MMAPAPQFGNTEIPPEDGFTWRKYGQKEIYGSIYPRLILNSNTLYHIYFNWPTS